MLLEILELLDLFATVLAGLILVLGKMRFFMLSKPGLNKENLIAGGALIGWCRGIMFPHVKIQGGLISKVGVTGSTMERCFFHVLGSEVCLQPACIAHFQFTHRALLIFSPHTLHHVADLFCLVLSAWVFPQTQAVIHNKMVHGQWFVQIQGRSCFRHWVSGSCCLRHSRKRLAGPLPGWIVPLPILCEVDKWILTFQGTGITGFQVLTGQGIGVHHLTLRGLPHTFSD